MLPQPLMRHERLLQSWLRRLCLGGPWNLSYRDKVIYRMGDVKFIAVYVALQYDNLRATTRPSLAP